MAPKYTLHYFNVMGGRGESLRYLFAYDKVDYEDHRIDFPQWPEYKKTVPLGFLPQLEVKDGSNLKFGELTTIARYIAEKHGGRLESAEDNALVDEIATYMAHDIVPVMFAKFVYAKGEEEKASAAKHVREEYNTMFPILYKLMGFDKGKQWASGTTQVTYADFIVAAFVELFNKRLYDGKFGEQGEWGSAFMNHLKRVHALPGVKQYVAKRPETPF